MQEKMKAKSTINNDISVLAQDRDVTFVNNNTNIMNSSERLSTPYYRGNLRRLSADNCYMSTENTEVNQILRRLIQTSNFLENSENYLLSEHQNKSQINISTERRLSAGSNGNLCLNIVTHPIFQEGKITTKLGDSDRIKAKGANSNLTYKCPSDLTQRKGSLESLTRDVTQDLKESFPQEHQHDVNDDLLENHIQNIPLPILKSAPSRLQDHDDTHDCALTNILDTELQIEQDVGSISDELNHTSFGEKDLLANNPEVVMKVHQEHNKHLPEYLQSIIEAKQVCGDSYVEFSKPHWLDEEKFQRGQRFARDHLFGIMVSDLISLLILFAFPSGLDPLIFTGKSDTPFKAFKRYLSTNVRVSTWYDGDIWDSNSEAHKNLKTVRTMHETVRRRMMSGKKEEVEKQVTLENPEGTRLIWTDLHEEVREDFERSCPVSGLIASIPGEVYVSQSGMAMTQFGFLGLVLVYPKWFGIFYAKDDDWDGFLHFWRTIAYLLGVEDRFNLCNGDVATVRQRCEDIIQYYVKPALTQVSRDWMHMSRVMIEGVSLYIVGISFEVLLLYLCNMLHIKAEKLSSALTFKQRLQYINICFVLWFVLRFSIMWDLMNCLVRLAIKITLGMKPERLEKLRQRVYPYEKRAIVTK